MTGYRQGETPWRNLHLCIILYNSFQHGGQVSLKQISQAKRSEKGKGGGGRGGGGGEGREGHHP